MWQRKGKGSGSFLDLWFRGFSPGGVQWRVGGYRRYRPWSRSDLRVCQNHADPFASAWDPVAATASRL